VKYHHQLHSILLEGKAKQMRLSVVEMSEDETIFYNLGMFKEHEDLIVFPMHEFQNFYKEMEHRQNASKI
jgi:hypothetical protein